MLLMLLICALLFDDDDDMFTFAAHAFTRRCERDMRVYRFILSPLDSACVI